MRKILLVDDCEDTGLLVKSSLNPYLVHQVKSIAEVNPALTELTFDLLLIDVTLPDGNGFELCKSLSSDLRYLKTPRILLTAKTETSEKVYGFACGADDYVTKPFNTAELKARVDRYILRPTEILEKTFESSGFAFDLEFQKCYRIDTGRQDLSLTPTEFRLFLTLVKNAGQVLTRKELELVAWEAVGTAIEAKGINTHIAHLRKKLAEMKNLIISVYGQGYSFKVSELPEKKAA